MSLKRKFTALLLAAVTVLGAACGNGGGTGETTDEAPAGEQTPY